MSLCVQWIERFRGELHCKTGLEHPQPVGNARCNEHQISCLQRNLDEILPLGILGEESDQTGQEVERLLLAAMKVVAPFGPLPELQTSQIAECGLILRQLRQFSRGQQQPFAFRRTGGRRNRDCRQAMKDHYSIEMGSGRGRHGNDRKPEPVLARQPLRCNPNETFRMAIGYSVVSDPAPAGLAGDTPGHHGAQ